MRPVSTTKKLRICSRCECTALARQHRCRFAAPIPKTTRTTQRAAYSRVVSNADMRMQRSTCLQKMGLDGVQKSEGLISDLAPKAMVVNHLQGLLTLFVEGRIPVGYRRSPSIHGLIQPRLTRNVNQRKVNVVQKHGAHVLRSQHSWSRRHDVVTGEHIASREQVGTKRQIPLDWLCNCN